MPFVVAICAGMPYEQLYAEHEPAARRLALALVPEHAAGDIVAEAFTKVLEAASRHGPPRAFGPYLLTAVRNTAVSYHARGRRLVPVPDPEPAPADGPEHQLSEREDARLAAAAFRTLPSRWQTVLWATAVEEASVSDLAVSWGMSANSVSQLASRAREGLRQAYLTEHLGAVAAPACQQVAPYMGAAVRGKAGRRHQQRLGAHLAGCRRCAQAYAGLGALNTSLGELLVPAAAVAGLTRALARGTRASWHPVAAMAGLAVTVASMAAVPFVTAVPGAVHARAQGAAFPPRVSTGAHLAPASAAPAPPASAEAASAAPAAVVTPAAPVTVPQALSGTLRTVGGTVTGASQAVSQVITGTGQAANGTTVAAAGAVSAVAGTAGQLVQNAVGTAGGLLSGL